MWSSQMPGLNMPQLLLCPCEAMAGCDKTRAGESCDTDRPTHCIVPISVVMWLLWGTCSSTSVLVSADLSLPRAVPVCPGPRLCVLPLSSPKARMGHWPPLGLAQPDASGGSAL